MPKRKRDRERVKVVNVMKPTYAKPCISVGVHEQIHCLRIYDHMTDFVTCERHRSVSPHRSIAVLILDLYPSSTEGLAPRGMSANHMT